MSWRLSDKELTSVLQLSSDRRYAYSINKFADTQEVWCLRRPGDGAIFTYGHDREVAPLWPHEKYAAIYASDGRVGLCPGVLDVHDFVYEWPLENERECHQFSIFPTPADAGRDVAYSQLQIDILSELSRIE